MKTTTVSKRFIALLCCLAVCIALIATALGVNLASRAQAEDAQEDEIALLAEEEPAGDIQLIEEEAPAAPGDITGGEAYQTGEPAVTEDAVTPDEEPVSGEPDETPLSEETAVSEETTDPVENPLIIDEATEGESGVSDDLDGSDLIEAEAVDADAAESDDADADATEAEPDNIDADTEEGDTDAIDADEEDADAEDADAEEEAASDEDDYGIMLLADSGNCGENLIWELNDDGVLTISGNGAMYDWSAGSHAPWYGYRYSITSVVIDEGVTSIGDWAFYDCSLTSISIPGSVTSIGECAFDWCTSLTDISIPYGVASIGYSAFAYCTSLASVELPSTLTSIGDNAFRDCDALTYIEIPEGVTSIGDYVFQYCTSLDSIELPPTLISIGDYAFNNCYALTDISIPEGVTSIGDYAFNNCYALTDISIPEGVTSIGASTFAYCESLASVELPNTLTSIGDWAFWDCSTLTDISIPEGVTSIGYEAFSHCTSLASVELPSTLTSIGEYAFQYCPLNGDSMMDTTTVSAGAEVYSITSEDTTYTTQTTTYTGHTLTLPESVTSVGAYAFDNTSLDYFVIGSSLTSITGSAFASSSLEAIIFDNSKDRVNIDNYADIVNPENSNVVTLVYLDGENGFELSLTKEVKDYSDFDTFEFEITLIQQDGTPFSGELDASLSDGTEEAVSFTDGKATVSVGSGEILTLLWVPEDMEWSIVELTEADRTVISVNGSEVSDAEGTLTEDTAVTFVNYYNIGITVSIVWDDADNQDGIRPDSITVQLLADGAECGDAVTLDDSNNWSYTWTELPVYADGVEISYSVQEINVPEGYEADYGGLTDNGNGTYSIVITNTHTPAQLDAIVIKEWDDADNQDGIRPESITVELWADNTEVVATATITPDEDGIWSYTFEDLDMYCDGKAIVYSVDEVVPNGYEIEESLYVFTSGTAFDYELMAAPYVAWVTITNTHTPEQFDATVIKEWDDNDDQDGIRPDSITVHLWADNTYEVASATITPDEDGIWSYTFEGLDKYRDGIEIVYSVTEDDVWGYVNDPLWLLSSDGTSSFELMAADSSTDKSVTITNTHTPEQFDATVIKEWDDADDQDGIRPDSITVHLWADNTEVVASATITPDEDGTWSYTFEGLPKYRDGGIEIVYSVTEDDVQGYVNDPLWLLSSDGTSSFELMAIDSSTDKSVTITNTHIPEAETPAPTMSDDVGAGTEVAPGESLTYTIRYTNGDQDGATITITDVLDEGLDFVSATDGGTYDEATRTITWVISDVAAGAEGSVSFTVVVNESALVAGEVSNSATVQIADDAAVATNIVTNPVKALSTVTFEVVKVWNDNNDLYGARPDRIVVVLLQNGQATSLTQLLSAENSWTGTFSDLPEYDADGNKIAYSIAEVTVPNYTSVITGDQDSGFTVTNTYDFDEITNPEPGTPDSGNPNSGNPNTGTPNSSNPEPGVPQTGQDSLPIAPLAVSGAAIVAAGVALLMVRRRRAA